MRMAFFINDIMTEEPGYTTNRLAVAAMARGYEAWVINSEDFTFDDDDKVKAVAMHAPKMNYASGRAWLNDMQSGRAKREYITVDDLDVLLLRSDPAKEMPSRHWAQHVGINFGRIAMRHGVIVLNDPNGLAKAINKTYFQLFPEEVRPRTVITRNKKRIREFAREMGGTVVLKPVQGSGGQGVFLIHKDDTPNLNQIIDALSKDGYIIAQEYLPAAAAGDTRLFLMNGLPLRYKGKYAAFRRVSAGEDMRSNVHAGGSIQKTEVTEQMLVIAEMVRPKLVQDGMFLVGLDIVGDKLMEINVFSPGGLGSAQKFEGVNFSNAVIDSLERKVAYMRYYRRNFANVELATL